MVCLYVDLEEDEARRGTGSIPGYIAEPDYTRVWAMRERRLKFSKFLNWRFSSE